MKISSTFGKHDKYIYYWLMTGCALVILMVVIGGITRLTQSGLSMVKWEPIVGTLPPMSESAWQNAFDLYKQSPEFHYYNAHFTLQDFKSIFFWEYLHRLIARLIGLVFIIPFVVFWFKGYFRPGIKRHVLIIFALGALQGLLGWLMVKSGLVDKPHVSHYRLAAHLIMALSLVVYIFWIALSVKYQYRNIAISGFSQWVRIFIGLLFFQLIYGAFVAGLKAGWIYTTFPKMGNDWIPAEFSTIVQRDGFTSLFDSPGIVQLIHRLIAFSLFAGLIVLWIKSRTEQLTPYQSRVLRLVSVLLVIQFLFGVFTLLHSVPVTLGVLHQFGAILVLMSSVYLLFTLKVQADDHFQKILL